MDMTALIQAITKLHETSGIIQLASIIAIIASPLLAVWLTSKRTLEAEKRKDKIVILNALMLGRLNRSSLSYVNAINTIDVVFYDSIKVRDVLKALVDEYWKEKPDFDVIKNKNLRLIEEIINDLGYGKHINWEQVSRPYTPKWYFEELENQEKFKQGQLQFVELIAETSKTTKEKKG